CAPVAVAVADYHGQVAVILWLAASIPLLAAVTSPWWAQRIHSASPTTLQWAARCEAIALALCLPMAAHLAGLFEVSRGLGYGAGGSWALAPWQQVWWPRPSPCRCLCGWPSQLRMRKTPQAR